MIDLLISQINCKYTLILTVFLYVLMLEMKNNYSKLPIKYGFKVWAAFSFLTYLYITGINSFYGVYILLQEIIKKSIYTLQEVINTISIASLRACGRLAGLYKEAPPSDDGSTNGEIVASDVTPPNTVIANALSAMLTPYVVSQIAIKTPQQVSKKNSE